MHDTRKQEASHNDFYFCSVNGIKFPEILWKPYQCVPLSVDHQVAPEDSDVALLLLFSLPTSSEVVLLACLSVLFCF